MLTANNFMSRNVITVTRETSIAEAFSLMYENRVRHLPVIDTDKMVIGMISDRDIQRAMMEQARNKVAEYMCPTPFTALQHTPVGMIVEEMMSKNISSVIIIDERSRCVGIVTSNDILRVFLKQLERNREILEKPMSFFLSNTLY